MVYVRVVTCLESYCMFRVVNCLSRHVRLGRNDVGGSAFKEG